MVNAKTEFNEVVVYDLRSDSLVTIQREEENLWTVRTALFPNGYRAEVNLNQIFVEGGDEYLALGVL